MIGRETYALLGHPVAHSVSPAMCNAAFRAMGLPHDYIARDTPDRDALLAAIGDLQRGVLTGANVTLPHKRAVLDLVSDAAASAREVGAANVLVVGPRGRIVAHNTDVAALVDDIEALAPNAPRMQAAIIGAGGAGMAAVVACRRLGFKVVGITSRSWTDSTAIFEHPAAEQARALGALTFPWPSSADSEPPQSGHLSRSLRLHFRDLSSRADLVIQATSAGMRGADPGEDVSEIIPWSRLPKHALAYDVVYNPSDTPFVRAAQERGLRAASGIGMLARQAAIAIRLWSGQAPPVDLLRAEAEAALDLEPTTDRYWNPG